MGSAAASLDTYWSVHQPYRLFKQTSRVTLVNVFLVPPYTSTGSQPPTAVSCFNNQTSDPCHT